MKRFLSLIFVVALTLVLVGCGGNGLADKYGADEKVKIAEEITADEAETLIEEAQTGSEEIAKVTIDINIEGEMSVLNQKMTAKGEAKLLMDISDEENIKMQMDYNITMKAAGETQKMEMHLYITDGYVYAHMNIPGEGEMKYKESLETSSDLGEMDQFLEAVEGLLDSLDGSLSEASFGKDKDGNLIVQSSEELDAEYNDEYRIVIKDGLVQYMYLEMNMSGMNFKYDYVYKYNEAKFSFPKNFDAYVEE